MRKDHSDVPRQLELLLCYKCRFDSKDTIYREEADQGINTSTVNNVCSFFAISRVRNVVGLWGSCEAVLIQEGNYKYNSYENVPAKIFWSGVEVFHN